MNKERLEMLAKHLEKLPREQFDMVSWCGTACCIAGHAVALADRERPSKLRDGPPSRVAAKWLGLGLHASEELFTPSDLGPNAGYDDITPKAAASVVRHLKDTGKVEWERFVS